MSIETKCGPDGCPIVAFSDLTPSEQREQRARKARTLYERGFTEQQIAKQFGVSQQTIGRDLSNLSTMDNSKPAKTASNPKGAGRPKGKKTKAVAEKHDKIVALADAGMKPTDIADTVGVGHRMVDRVLEVESVRRDAQTGDEPQKLSLTAQQKLDAAIRQHKKALDAEFDVRIRAELKRHLDDVALPWYLKQIQQLERSISDRRGIMDRVTYRKILACLHPDRVADAVLKKRYEEAFRLFTELEKRVLNEKESPTQFRHVPRTYEELMAAKAKVQAERRARRAERAGMSLR